MLSALSHVGVACARRAGEILGSTQLSSPKLSVTPELRDPQGNTQLSASRHVYDGWGKWRQAVCMLGIVCAE